MAIVDDDIERLKATVSIVDVVGEVVQLRKVGRNFVGLCPFHAEKTPSFNVREETGRYRCFGCDQSGDAFTFVQQTRHTDFVGAVEYLAAKVGMQLTYTNASQSAERSRRKRLVEAMEAAVEWYHIPTPVALGVIALILAVSVFLSIRFGENEPAHPEPVTGAEDDADIAEAVRDAVDADPSTHPGISGDRHV